MRSIFIIFVLVLFFSCKKEEAPPPHRHVHDPCGGSHTMSYISQDAKRLKFRPGSYWVYLDSITLQTDSTFVDAVVLDAMIGDYYSCNRNEVYAYKLKSGLTGTSQPYTLVSNVLIRNTLPFPGATGSYLYMSYNYVPSYHPSNPPGDTIFVRDSSFVYDRFYTHTVIIQRTQDPNEDSLKTVYYSNSDYGLLRKEVFNTNGTLKNRWVLKSKQVIR